MLSLCQKSNKIVNRLKVEVDKKDIEQLENDLYKIEVKASVLREAVSKISK